MPPGNVLNSVLHGLFDFMLSAFVNADGGAYAGTAAIILDCLVLTVILLVRHRRVGFQQVAPRPG